MTHETRGAIVWGGGGFAGGELLRLLAVHPRFRLAAALSGSLGGMPIAAVYPGLAPWTDLEFTSPSHWSWDRVREGAWALFLALPHGEAMRRLPSVLEETSGAGLKVIDLSGDFRLEDPALFRKFYGEEHEAPELLGKFVYGLPELYRDRIASADLIACPGCFATGAQLALLPAAASRRPVRCVAIDGKTGSSGAGAAPGPATHHPLRMNNFSAYGQLAHRHFPEIRKGWRAAGGAAETLISFVPQRAPMVRGIFTTAHIFLEEPVGEGRAAGWYTAFYGGAPFARIVEGSPSVAGVFGTNRCDISVTAAGRVLAVCTAIDNLVKGAAGQAVQNANIACGFEETAGLLHPAPAPV